MYFAVVNDTQEPIDLKLDSSLLNINGVDRLKPHLSFPKDAQKVPLAPGGYFAFDFDLSDLFSMAGAYKVTWKVAGFESAPIYFRVVEN